MDVRGLMRWARYAASRRGVRATRFAWRRRRIDARGLPDRGREPARAPGPVTGAEPQPGGGIVRFARSELRICVVAGGAVFWGWDGAGPEPSYALAGGVPEPDGRAGLEPDKDGGWRVVSERVTVEVSRVGAVAIRTPGGIALRRELPPRWWEPVGGGPARWTQRAEVAADARFFGLGGRASGPRLRDGAYRLWNTAARGPAGSGDGPPPLTMPVQLVVADAGTHLAFQDSTWDGVVTLREGEEGAGSGHDRPGTVEVRMEGGPLRCWVIVGRPARVLAHWARLTGAPAAPPSWALGPQCVGPVGGGVAEAVRTVAAWRERGLPLSAVHVDAGGPAGSRAGAPFGSEGSAPVEGVRLVSVVAPAVPAEPGNAVYEEGAAAGAFVRDGSGREVRGVDRAGECVYPDFTDPRVRRWWGGLYGEDRARGFSGVWHERNEPVSPASFGDRTLPRSARHDLDGRGGDHREGHNVYGLTMARAGYEGLLRARPGERPFLVSRSGWAGMQRYGGAGAGEVCGDWRGLRAALSAVLGLGLCGVPYAGPDLGGGDGAPSAELWVRGLQLGAYLPLFRIRAAAGAGPGEPWEFGPVVLGHARAALGERERLRPYFVTLAHMARLTGAPYARPLWWGSPEDRSLRGCEDAFLLGDALLVAPVLEEGVERRPVRLPKGRWYDRATGRVYDGPGRVVLDAPLSRAPVLARGGSVIPVRGADGGVELEVWAPAAGRRGGGVVVPDPGDGWEEAEVERYTTRLVDGRVRVRRVGAEGSVPPGRPVRVRGL
ncbi:glycoside hydrolase family 31 protein [Streptomyces sp. NPDC014894]|uniref:glycoside hydrolase family 31 protein n=1 Tax=Streptomyces sp. NPDC014894 TaxID=3364931 RepID=UPI0036F95016